MGLLVLVICAIALLLTGYFSYGILFSKILKLRTDARMPAYEFKNGLDFEPAGKFYLLGQHLSAIAAAGPIVGPILAGLWFGWAPAILWIILGGIFIGGIHDMSALVASIRHRGQSIAEVIKESMSRRAFILFLLFLWLSLVYIIIAFTDITASTFTDAVRGSAVASSSMMYLGLAVIMGVILRRFNLSIVVSTLIFLPIVFLCIYLGPLFPLSPPSILGLDGRTSWNITLLFYCFLASVIPVWLLLQPRGYLGGFFLTFTAALSLLGIIIGAFTQGLHINYPAFTGWFNPQGLPLFPFLFTTVACGACSGFHAIVASGTTSKQISRETDARLVGYGGMLLESFVAIIALGALVMLSRQEANSLNEPNQIYANGVATFLNSLGIKKEFAFNLALLAFATFVYDTLDVATRLGRYIFQELTGWKSKASPYTATLGTLFLPLAFVSLPVIFMSQRNLDSQGNPIPAWRVFWTVFGSSNQLLAGLVLFCISVWLFESRKKYLITLLPAFFMILVACVSLSFILWPSLYSILNGRIILDTVGITSCVLLFLAVLLIMEGLRIFKAGRS
ncbi:MAG: carbon starvation CstA family protein [Candidatus Omnitrophota bacterium]